MNIQAQNPTKSPQSPAPPPDPLSRADHPGIDYWRIERDARFLDLSKKRVYQLVREKKLQAVRLGPRQMRILRSSLDDYLQALLKDPDLT